MRIFYSLLVCGLSGVFYSTLVHAGIVTAKSTLPRGTIIQADDLDVVASKDENTEDILSVYVGKELKRTVSSGYKLNPAYVGKPVTVRRNSRVNMVYKMGALEISAWGRALEEGGIGDIITVMNLESRQKVQGMISETGTIRVGL